jgi:hypothetical protein
MRLATHCLDIISHGKNAEPNLLYACIKEAEDFNDKTQAIAVVRKVISSYDHNRANGAQFPRLLRYGLTFRMLTFHVDASQGVKRECSWRISSKVDGTRATLLVGSVTSSKLVCNRSTVCQWLDTYSHSRGLSQGKSARRPLAGDRPIHRCRKVLVLAEQL